MLYTCRGLVSDLGESFPFVYVLSGFMFAVLVPGGRDRISRVYRVPRPDFKFCFVLFVCLVVSVVTLNTFKNQTKISLILPLLYTGNDATVTVYQLTILLYLSRFRHLVQL